MSATTQDWNFISLGILWTTFIMPAPVILNGVREALELLGLAHGSFDYKTRLHRIWIARGYEFAVLFWGMGPNLSGTVIDKLGLGQFLRTIEKSQLT